MLSWQFGKSFQNEALKSGAILYFMFYHVRNLTEIGELRRGFHLVAHKHHLLGKASISHWFRGVEQFITERVFKLLLLDDIVNLYTIAG